MSDSSALLITLIAYKIVLIMIGLVGKGRTGNSEDYFLGGRNLGPLVAAVSASASSSSVWTLLGVSGAAYGWGLPAIWLFPGCVGGFALNWLLVAPALRRYSRETGALTVTDVLAGPPGTPRRRAVQILASMIVVTFFMFYVASQFAGAGKAFAQALDVSRDASILIGAAIVVFYTLLGGFWAVSLTDSLQGLLMAATAVVLPVAALVHLGGGGFVDGLRAVDETGYLALTRGAGTWAGIGFVAGILGIGLGYPGQPHVVNRFMALQEGEASLRRARVIALAWAVVVYAGMILLGLCGRVLLGGLEDPEKVFLHVAGHLFHPVIAGIMVAAVLSAIMSTADSQLLVAGSAVSHDLDLGGHSSVSLLRRSRLVVLVVAAAATLVALYFPASIYERVLFAWSVMGAAFGPPLVVIVLRRRLQPTRTLAAMACGLLLTVAAKVMAAEGWVERVVPIAASLAIMAWPARRE